VPFMKTTSIESLYEEWFFTRVLQIISKRVIVLYLLSVLFLLWGVYSCYKFSMYSSKKRAEISK